MANNRVAIYARVSTSNHGQDTAVQLRDLTPFIAARGWAVADQYIDTGISGSKDRRPELDRLMKDAHARKFDVVVVWRFDRFARSVSHLLRALETFNALGIAFVSLSEQMDTTTPAGKMVFTVLGAVAELERSLIVERVKAGLRNARAKGKRLGRPRAIVDVAQIARLRAQGRSWRKIARVMGCSAKTCRRVWQKALASFVPMSAARWTKTQRFRSQQPLENTCTKTQIFSVAKSGDLGPLFCVPILMTGPA